MQIIRQPNSPDFIKVRHFAATAELDVVNGGVWVLYCPPKYRRQGYATGLMTSIIEYAKEMKLKKLFLSAGGYNDADMQHSELVKFYSRLGFSHVEYYKGHGCRMELPIGSKFAQ